jgi:hypothetical protein
MVLLERYSFQPGDSGATDAAWPRAARLPHQVEAGWRLVVALHPECPCSRATVEELNRLLAARPDAFRIRALFVARQSDAETSPLWQALRRMSGVDLVADPQGIEARQFGFRTSGEVRLYDENLQLRFHGGVTISRGHRGDNPGSAAILTSLDARECAVIATPVFGCALFDSAWSTNLR